jgi:ABC-2 type transport system ATP-binding protein
MVTDGLPVIEFHREERNLEDAFIDMLGTLDKQRNTGLATAG